jgi:hypothetical protein
MKYVLDSNVALRWVLPEPDADTAVRVRDDFRRDVTDLLSPDVFPFEIARAREGRAAWEYSIDRTLAQARGRIDDPASLAFLSFLGDQGLRHRIEGPHRRCR